MLSFFNIYMHFNAQNYYYYYSYFRNSNEFVIHDISDISIQLFSNACGKPACSKWLIIFLIRLLRF